LNIMASSLFSCRSLFTVNSSTRVPIQSHLNNQRFTSSRLFTTATPNPAIEFKTNAEKPRDFVSTNDLFKNRKVLLVGIVGAFTGVCDNQIPPFAEHLADFKAKGIQEIAVVSINDPAVMKAFAKSLNIPSEKILFLADFDGAFTKSLSMEVDLTAAKLGKRSKRYAMLVDNGKIASQWVEEKPRDFVSTNDLFKNRKVLLVGIVGAFTGVCDNQIPPFAEHLPELKAKGIQEIAVVSVNDPAVMKAFAKSLNIPPEKVLFLADFDGAFTRSLSMEVDLTAAKLGKRSKRYAMLVDNGKIASQWVEEKPSDLKVSSAENVLKNL